MPYLLRHGAYPRLTAVLSGLVLSACGPSLDSRPPSRPDGQSGASARPSGSGPQARRAHRPAVRRRTSATAGAKTTSPPTLIHGSGVGNLHVGRAIPAAYLRPTATPEQRYTLGFHADAQNYEGFRFSKGSVLVVLNRRLFRAWFDDPQRKGSGFPDPATQATFARAAVKAARGGAPISWLVIDRPGPQTRKKIGVGSTLADLTRAYGTLKLLTTPPDFGRDQCSVLITPLKNVRAFFRTCSGAKAGGKITRLSIWITRN